MNDAPTTLLAHMREQIGKVIFGADDVVRTLTIALVARGHVLLEGPPGLGKTLLGRTFSTILGGNFKRIQGTADLLPTDITGVHVFDESRRVFEFQPGPVFADVLLVDEINRAGPKTQSALLQAMEERQVTVDRETFPLNADFLVIATQNPREFEGTYPLPESQLDRFMLSCRMHYPARADEARIIEAYNLPQTSRDATVAAVSSLPEGLVDSVRQRLESVHLAPELVNYMLDVAVATRESASVALGLSSRGVLALARCARVAAALRGGEYVVPDDVKDVAQEVIAHRLLLAPEAMLEGTSAASVLEHVLESIPVPR